MAYLVPPCSRSLESRLIRAATIVEDVDIRITAVPRITGAFN
jgi:hypothetical protein